MARAQSARERRQAQTREQLLDAAATVFAERGFHAATLDEIGQTAGFSKGAVYSNFASKDDLFVALINARGTAMVEAYADLGVDTEAEAPARIAASPRSTSAAIPTSPSNGPCSRSSSCTPSAGPRC